MHLLRLFHTANPTRQLDARTLDRGDIAIGRDAGAGWVIPDPTGHISRLHCILAAADGRLTLQDLSANGVFVGETRERAPSHTALPLNERETLALGEFLITVEPAVRPHVSPECQVGSAPSLCRPATLSVDELGIPEDWTSISEPKGESGSHGPEATTDLFRAFCEGAKLNPSDFGDEDPADVMRRVGAMYQATVLGLSALMGDRRIAKEECGMEKTRIAPAQNNPFRFTPTTKLGSDLLRGHKRGFVTGADALKTAFVDVRKHLVAIMAGSRAVLNVALDALSPERVDQSLEGESFFFSNRYAAAWRDYERRYIEFRLDALSNPNGAVDLAFRHAYERQLLELDDLSRSGEKVQ